MITKDYRIEIEVRPHGGLACFIYDYVGEEERLLAGEGYFGTYFQDIDEVFQWLKEKLN